MFNEFNEDNETTEFKFSNPFIESEETKSNSYFNSNYGFFNENLNEINDSKFNNENSDENIFTNFNNIINEEKKEENILIEQMKKCSLNEKSKLIKRKRKRNLLNDEIKVNKKIIKKK